MKLLNLAQFRAHWCDSSVGVIFEYNIFVQMIAVAAS